MAKNNFFLKSDNLQKTFRKHYWRDQHSETSVTETTIFQQFAELEEAKTNKNLSSYRTKMNYKYKFLVRIDAGCFHQIRAQPIQLEIKGCIDTHIFHSSSDLSRLTNVNSIKGSTKICLVYHPVVGDTFQTYQSTEANSSFITYAIDGKFRWNSEIESVKSICKVVGNEKSEVSIKKGVLEEVHDSYCSVHRF